MGRKQPYTERGIKRVPCLRCGKPSCTQWQICALDNIYEGVCKECDVELNRLVLRFMKVPNVTKIIQRYKNENA